jgi:hypothetical protein
LFDFDRNIGRLLLNTVNSLHSISSGAVKQSTKTQIKTETKKSENMKTETFVKIKAGFLAVVALANGACQSTVSNVPKGTHEMGGSRGTRMDNNAMPSRFFEGQSTNSNSGTAVPHGTHEMGGSHGTRMDDRAMPGRYFGQ